MTAYQKYKHGGVDTLGTLTQIGAKSVHIMPPVVNLGRSASPSARPAAVRYTRVSFLASGPAPRAGRRARPAHDGTRRHGATLPETAANVTLSGLKGT